MATTYELIQSLTVTSSPTSVSFTSIPGTYDDLVLHWTGREDIHNGVLFAKVTFNGSGSGYSHRYNYITSDGNSYRTYATGRSDAWFGLWTANGFTANQFGTTSIYIPSYTGSANKVFTFDTFGGGETTGSGNFCLFTGQWANSSAITSFTVASDQGSYTIYTGTTFWLYGIKKS